MNWLGLAAAVAWPPAWGVICRSIMLSLGRPRDYARRTGWLGLRVAASVDILTTGTGTHWLGSAVSAAWLIAAWFWRRRRRRSALALIGAKSRALRDALVRRAREAAKPRPVLRPAPGGAR